MDLDEFILFRDACKGMGSDFDIIKIKLCYEFGWTEEQVNAQDIGFNLKCLIYVEEAERRKNKTKPKKQQSNYVN